MEQIIPKIDTKVLQEKANQYAQEGAISTIKDFYTGYNSPYKKAIEEALDGKGIDRSLNLPDIIDLLNKGISDEVDRIANAAVSKTFIPMVTQMLTRAPKETTLSAIMREFIESMDFDGNDDNWEDYTIDFEEGSVDSFMYIVLSNGDEEYTLRFYNFKNNNTPEDEKEYTMYSLPDPKKSGERYRSINKTMTIKYGDVKLEMPFTPGVLNDGFVSLIARYILAGTKIKMDVKEFDEEMFPEPEHCHC